MELQQHDELSRKAAKMMRLNFDDTIDPTGDDRVSVVSVTDPNPSRGYILIAVVDGLTRCAYLSQSVGGAREALHDVKNMARQMGLYQ
jgi:hypothetical protein